MIRGLFFALALAACDVPAEVTPQPKGIVTLGDQRVADVAARQQQITLHVLAPGVCVALYVATSAVAMTSVPCPTAEGGR